MAGEILWKECLHSPVRAEMNQHITNSGKKVASIQHHSIPTNLKKGKTFLTDQYLKDIEATSDQRHFYFRAKCYHSFNKFEAPVDSYELGICSKIGL